MNCVYRLYIPFDQELLIFFNYFHLESQSWCRWVQSNYAINFGEKKSIQYIRIFFFYFLWFVFAVFLTDRYDYLRITNDKNQIVGTYCGYQAGERVVVVGSAAVLIFRSDSSFQGGGFHLSFTFRRGKLKIILGKFLFSGLNLVKTYKFLFRASN